MGWLDMPLTLISHSRPCCQRGHTDLTVLRLSDNQLPVGAQFGRASLINTAQSPSVTPLPLHQCTLGGALTYS